MKYLKEIAIIFGITMIGELLNQWIPFPVPAGAVSYTHLDVYKRQY